MLFGSYKEISGSHEKALEDSVQPKGTLWMQKKTDLDMNNLGKAHIYVHLLLTFDFFQDFTFATCSVHSYICIRRRKKHTYRKSSFYVITSVSDVNNGVVELTGTWPFEFDFSFLYTCLVILLSFIYNKNILTHFPMLVLQLQLIVTPSGNSVEPLLILGANQRPWWPSWLMVISLWYSLPASIILSFSSLLYLSISPLLSSKVSGPFNGNYCISTYWPHPFEGFLM